MILKHGVDWEGLKNRYGALIEDARSRWDVSNIQSNLAAELSAGHTYTFGGDVEQVPVKHTGFLGIDWEEGNNGFSIRRIIKPALEAREGSYTPGKDQYRSHGNVDQWLGRIRRRWFAMGISGT